MTRDSKSTLRSLAGTFSGTSVPCPVPSTHDKLTEAHYFIHRMLDAYHEPDGFRYNLSAFLQAAKSCVMILRKELQNDQKAVSWLRGEPILQDKDVRLIQHLRDSVVHRESLIPASSGFIGLFKYGRDKMGFRMPFDPMIESGQMLQQIRNNSKLLVPAHREWIGEELGISRTWSIEELAGREFVKFCADTWEKIATVVGKAHQLRGAEYGSTAECKHAVPEAQVLRESQLFPEILKAWDVGDPTEEVSPIDADLPLYQYASQESPVLHRIQAGASALGWVNEKRIWGESFISMLLLQVNDQIVEENTCVFFNIRCARVRRLPGRKDDSPDD